MINNLSMELKIGESYLAIVRNSVGSQAFRNIFASDKGEHRDILNNGRLSCAYFVSSILKIFDLARSPHATVSGTVRDLLSSGWVEINELKPGAVIEWKEIDYGPEGKHKHIGFYVGDNKAVSNDFEAGKIIEHELYFRGREIEKILWNQALEQK